MKGAVSLFAAALCAASFAHAEESSATEGAKLAEAYCSKCHNIAPGGAFKLYPPSFQAIAIYMDPELLRMKIMYPEHVTIMPQFHEFMGQTSLDQLVSYIRSLDE